MSKKVVFIVIGIIVIGIILFSVKSKGNVPAGDDGIVATTESNLGNDFIKALLGVNTISLDISLFNSPVFNSLNSSGAYVNPMPEKGRIDPFSKIGNTANIISNSGENASSSSRDISLGVNQIGNAEIIVSKITTTTASIAIRGLSQGDKVSAILLGSNDSLITLPSFTYKSDTGDFTSVATGLTSKITYTVRIQTPLSSAGLQAEFTTR